MTQIGLLIALNASAKVVKESTTSASRRKNAKLMKRIDYTVITVIKMKRILPTLSLSMTIEGNISKSTSKAFSRDSGLHLNKARMNSIPR